MKKKILALALAVVLVAVAGYSTLAYFTAEDVATNTITAATLEIQINEYLTEGGAAQQVDETGITISAENVVPGDTVAKIPKVKNLEDSTNAWIRVRVTFTYLNAPVVTSETNPVSLVLGADWTLHTDGYYYYNTIVDGGEETTALFTGVAFDLEDMTNEWQGATITINLDAQAVQSDNQAAGTIATTALGWPAFPVTP